MRAFDRLCVLVLVLLVAGCGLSGTTHRTVFPERGDDPPLAALPLDVIDMTGLVQGVALLDFDPLDPPTNGVVAKGRGLEVSWVGGTCDGSARLIVFRHEDGRVRIRQETSPTLSGLLGCSAVGVLRAVTITMRVDMRQQDVHPLLDRD